jgi:heterotetrameric sarcosine oxidase gamma subunit
MGDKARYSSPIGTDHVVVGAVTLTDESGATKWRTWTDPGGVPIGHSRRTGDTLMLAVAPAEWIVVGPDPGGDAVDLSHVRASIRVSGARARELMSYVCALDLGDLMTPAGSAARTLVAGVATELVRDDQAGEISFLLMMSRSFARSVWDRLHEVASHLEHVT